MFAPSPFTAAGRLPTFAAPAAGRAVFGAAFAPLSSSPLSPASKQTAAAYWSKYLRRGLSVSQWDLENTFYQFINSCKAPEKVYTLTQHRKHATNHWARDDPSFLAALLVFLAVVAIAYGVAYRYTSPAAYLWLVSASWLSFFGWGLAVSTSLWALLNRHCRVSVSLPHSVEQNIEWLFAWDVHCNAFVPVLLLIYVADYLLLPLTMSGDGLLPCLFGNSLYAWALGHYVYITFKGYMVLPFLQHEKLRPMLLGIVAAAVLGVGATLLHINIARAMLGFSVA